MESIITKGKEIYFKLPYVGQISAYTEKNLNQIIEPFCKTGV